VEYIIIDGGSTDGTLDIIKKYYEDYIDYWVNESDKGIYDAMNKGIDLATGQWINFMNAGDRFYDENLIEEIFPKDLRKKVLIYDDAILMPLNIIQKQENWHLDILKRIIHQSIFTPLVCLKKKKFNLKCRIMADYDLVRYCINESGVVSLDKIICYYDYNGVSSKPLFCYFHEYLEISKKYSSNMIEKFKIYLHIIPRVIYLAIKFPINYFGGYFVKHET
jgi:glycosyltransferase involved in cell wall biosynthesis